MQKPLLADAMVTLGRYSPDMYHAHPGALSTCFTAVTKMHAYAAVQLASRFATVLRRCWTCMLPSKLAACALQ